MRILFFIPIVLSLVVLGAHFLREGNMLGVVVAVVLIGLLFVRKVWVPRVVQVVLVLGAMEWVWTLYTLVEIRAAHGQSYTRMAVILGVVTLITLLSALLFQTRALKKIYGSARKPTER